MKCKSADALILKIESTINNINTLQNISKLEESYLAKFLIVYTCGIYEEAIECIIKERISLLGSKRLSNYANQAIEKGFRNPNTSNVCGLLGQFDKNWKKKIRALPSIVQQCLDSICEDKNSLAHGNNCTVTLSDAIQYFKKSKTIIIEIDKIVNFK